MASIPDRLQSPLEAPDEGVLTRESTERGTEPVFCPPFAIIIYTLKRYWLSLT